MPQRHLTFTAVSYEAGDIVGYALAWCSLIPHVLLVVQATAFVLGETRRRRLQAGALLLGQTLNELANILLKRIIRQPRPLSMAHTPPCNV